MKNKQFLTISTMIILLSLIVISCTKLDEKLNSSVNSIGEDAGGGGDDGGESSGGTSATTLVAVFDRLRGITTPITGGVGPLQEHTSDEAIPPTRATDWDDAGQWRALHNHAYAASGSGANILNGTFNGLTQTIFTCIDFLGNPTATDKEKAQARYVRAYALWQLLDLFDKIAYKESAATDAPTIVKTKGEAVDFIVSELEAIESSLDVGDPSNAYVPSQMAVKTLLMKVYLNKAVYLSTDRTSFTFDKADMDMVVKLADDIISSGIYSLQTNYFENFVPNNDAVSKELIFTSQNEPGRADIHQRWYSGSHYNMVPSGWNGFTTLADFYNSFDENDKRLSTGDLEYTKQTGIRVGLLYGQQQDADGKDLLDRKGSKLFFTKEVSLIEKKFNLEVTGVRVFKYEPDLENLSTTSGNNDFVIFRYADVLLMKAEALLRGASPSSLGTAQDILNNLATVRNNSQTDATLDNLLAERGRELYWENHRRTDLIRFGKFLDARPTKNNGEVSDKKYIVFPIPIDKVTADITQNPGY